MYYLNIINLKFIDATTKEESAETYPECVDDNTLLRTLDQQLDHNITGYENGLLSYTTETFDNYCFTWNVYVDRDGVVKAYIYKYVNLTSSLETFRYGK